MARLKKPLPIVAPEGQLYACRDCPARCCRTPFSKPIEPESALIVLNDAELRARLVGRAPSLLAAGTLPQIEKDGQLQCVFLDEDELCGLQKRHGHAALPRACQAYPFSFTESETGAEHLHLSRHCPSVRDNYGEPVAPQLQKKRAQAGGARPVAARMGLPSGRTLPAEQYAVVADEWKQLFLAGSPLEAALSSYDLVESFDREFADLSGPLEPALGRARAALAVTGQPSAAGARAALRPARRPRFATRLFFAHEFGRFSSPGQLASPSAARAPRWYQLARALFNQLRWLTGRGRVKLLYITGPVPLARIDRVEPFLQGPLGALLGQYLVDLIERRIVFAKQTYLTRVAVDLGLLVALVSRFARASAAAAGRSQVERADVLEALGVADLIRAEQVDAPQSTVLANLRLQLMSDAPSFARFLASEA